MKLIPDFVRNALLRDIAGVPFNMNSPLMWNFFGSSFSDGELLLTSSDAWRYSVWTRRCVTSIARTITQLPLVAYRDQTELDTHPALDLLNTPSPAFSANEMWQLTIMMLNTWGEAFWLLGRNTNPAQRAKGVGQSFPKSITLATPDIMTEEVRPDADGNPQLVGWWVTTPTKRRFVNRADVAQFKFPNPFNPWRGAAPLESAGYAISGDINAQRFNIKIFKGARPGVALETDKQLPQTTVEEIRKDFIEKHRTPHIPAILHSGLKLGQQPSQSDMEFVGARKMNREEILAAFGVPPVEVGLLEYASYANAKEQRRAYWQTTLKPIIAIISDTITYSLLHDPALPQNLRAPNVKVEHDTDGVVELREDLNEKLDAAEKLWTKGVPFNVIDEKLELGIGKIEGGDIGYLPFSVQPISVVSSETLPSKPIKGEPTNLNPQDSPAEVIPGQNNPPPPQTKSVGTLLEELGAAIKSATKPAQITRESDPLGWLDEILNVSRETLKDLMKKPVQQSLKVGGEQMIQTLGLNVAFDLESPEAIAFLKNKLIKVTNITEVTREKLRATLLEGLAKGESIDNLAARIRETYNFVSGRSKTIARTEVSQSVNGGRFIVLKGEGADQHEWLSSHDERVRESHVAEDGHVVTVGMPFPTTNLTYPCDANGDPAEIINCRCITLPVATDSRAFRAIDREAYWKRSVAQFEPIERRLAVAMKRHFFEQRSKILEALAQQRF